MRTRSSRARICEICGSPMKKNGHDRLGSQRWMCTDCNATRGVRHYRRRDRGELGAFLAWLLGPAAQPGPSRTFRRRTAGCWCLCSLSCGRHRHCFWTA
ncbi:IS1/IS1595 family N-terminal zinc-binding domain-containing protein [Bifidobacterium pseudolongum]|uniref:IS1/IS1595 family N-terminal zinc-binding domain-containing protein n=1 Tax=Bifidobacterium pseudolongum TaxID=1694 RepID=UPI003BF5CC32